MQGQKGFIQILAIGALLTVLAGLGAGAYLVQQRTNILPRAEELPEPVRDIASNLGILPPALTSDETEVTISATVTPEPSLVSSPTPRFTVPASPSSTPSPTPPPAGSTGTPIPSMTPIPTTTASATPVASISASPTPLISVVPGQILYRISVDPRMDSIYLIDTGDGGVFGPGNKMKIPVTLSAGFGNKKLYVQFFVNGSWVPAVPLVAAINFRAPGPPPPTPTPVPPTLATKKVFLTTNMQSTDFGGLTGADNICQAAADATSIGGSWKAWLSSSTVSVKQRFTNTPIYRNNTKFTLVDGTKVADNWVDLTDGSLDRHIDMFADGKTFDYSVPGWSLVLTNTGTDGNSLATQPEDTCGDFTVNNNGKVFIGSFANFQSDWEFSRWTNLTNEVKCSSTYYRLYCFEQ